VPSYAAAHAPVGQIAPARPSSEPVAGQPPSAQPTAYSPRGLEHQYQLAAQTAIKQLSKFNSCHLSHIKEDTGQPSVGRPRPHNHAHSLGHAHRLGHAHYTS